MLQEPDGEAGTIVRFPPPGYHLVSSSARPVVVEAFAGVRRPIVLVVKLGDGEGETGAVPWFFRIEQGALVLHPEMSRSFPPLRASQDLLFDIPEIVETSDHVLWAAVAYTGGVSDRTYSEFYRLSPGGEWERSPVASQHAEACSPVTGAGIAFVAACKPEVTVGKAPGLVLRVLGAGRAQARWPRSEDGSSLTPTSLRGMPGGEIVATTWDRDAHIVVLRYGRDETEPTRQVFSDVPHDSVGTGSHLEDVSADAMTIVTDPSGQSDKARATRFSFAHGRWVKSAEAPVPWPTSSAFRTPLENAEPQLENVTVFRLSRDQMVAVGQLRTRPSQTLLLANFRVGSTQRLDAAPDPPLTPNAKGPRPRGVGKR